MAVMRLAQLVERLAQRAGRDRGRVGPQVGRDRLARARPAGQRQQREQRLGVAAEESELAGPSVVRTRKRPSSSMSRRGHRRRDAFRHGVPSWSRRPARPPVGRTPGQPSVAAPRPADVVPLCDRSVAPSATSRLTPIVSPPSTTGHGPRDSAWCRPADTLPTASSADTLPGPCRSPSSRSTSTRSCGLPGDLVVRWQTIALAAVIARLPGRGRAPRRSARAARGRPPVDRRRRRAGRGHRRAPGYLLVQPGGVHGRSAGARRSGHPGARPRAAVSSAASSAAPTSRACSVLRSGAGPTSWRSRCWSPSAAGKLAMILGGRGQGLPFDGAVGDGLPRARVRGARWRRPCRRIRRRPTRASARSSSPLVLGIVVWLRRVRASGRPPAGHRRGRLGVRAAATSLDLARPGRWPAGLPVAGWLSWPSPSARSSWPSARPSRFDGAARAGLAGPPRTGPAGPIRRPARGSEDRAVERARRTKGVS